MRYDERDDGELLELAQAGWSPAFAVLVHRHAPALLEAFADEPDAADRVTDVFVRAMRKLPDQDPAASVRGWLSALAGRPLREGAPPATADAPPATDGASTADGEPTTDAGPTTSSTPTAGTTGATGTVLLWNATSGPDATAVVAAPAAGAGGAGKAHLDRQLDGTVDAIWRELAGRWPDGRHRRRPRRRRPALRALATVVGAVALGVVVPAIVLGMPPATDDEVVTVRARPVEEAPEPEPESPSDTLPTFEFPDIGDPTPPGRSDTPATEPTTPGTDTPTPTAPVTPAPPPTAPEPDPTPVEPVTPPADPEPDPAPTPPPTTDPGTGDGGGGDGSGGDSSGGDAGEVSGPADGGGTP